MKILSRFPTSAAAAMLVTIAVPALAQGFPTSQTGITMEAVGVVILAE